MKTYTATVKEANRSHIESALHHLKNFFSPGEFTRKDIEKLATQTIISTDRLLFGRKYDKCQFINANDLCALMNDMGMIANAGKMKKGEPDPSGGSGAQATNFGIWQVDQTSYPTVAELLVAPNVA